MMPTWFLVLLTLVVAVCLGFVGYQIKMVRQRRRNVKHWEKDEPLEGGVDRWD